MLNEDFYKEVSGYSDDDLVTIIETQKDLYSIEEMEVLEEELQVRAQKDKNLFAKMPKEKRKMLLAAINEENCEIRCPKCDGPNPFLNSVCDFCGYNLEGEKEKVFEQPYDNSEMSSKAQYDFKKKLEKYRKEHGDPTEEVEAMLFAQAVELQTLKAPSSAQFCDLEQMTVSRELNGSYIVSGFVDSQNSYGAYIRDSFTLTVFKDEAEWKSADKFVPEGQKRSIGAVLIFISIAIDVVAGILIWQNDFDFASYRFLLIASGILFVIGLGIQLFSRK